MVRYTKKGTSVRSKRGYKKYKKHAVSDKHIAMIAKKVALREAETKFTKYDYNNVGGNYGSIAAATFNSVNWNGTVAALWSGVGQAVSENGRIGEELYATGVQINMAIQPAVPDIQNYFRIMLVQMKGDTVHAATTGTNLINDLLGGSGTNTSWLLPCNTERYKILLDRKMSLRALAYDGATAASTPQTRFVNKFIKLRQKVKYDAAEVVKNELFLVMISDSSIVPNPGAVAGYVKLWWKDN